MVAKRIKPEICRDKANATTLTIDIDLYISLNDITFSV